jgi:hypothetical protein
MIPKDFFRIIKFEECSENTHFPSTHAFNERWMLCLIFDAIQNLSINNELRFLAQCRKHSEARLDSRFQPAMQSDPPGEGQTHADGVIGDLDFREETRTGLRASNITTSPCQHDHFPPVIVANHPGFRRHSCTRRPKSHWAPGNMSDRL